MQLPENIRVFVILDEEVFEPKRFDPLDLDDPEEMLFPCFFKSEEDRALLLAALRGLANKPIDPVPGTLGVEVAEQFEACRLKNDAVGMLEATVRWWTAVKRRGYHAYKLRLGVDRYSCSCVVALRERTPRELHDAVQPALSELECARERVAGFFQFPFE